MKPKLTEKGGPGLLVAAAFIGPGTVTVCTLAGAKEQYKLLWVMIVSILTTIFLQEIAARIGIISRLDLSSLLRKEIRNPVIKAFVIVLVFFSIVIGNAAYEAGNISGATLGVNTFGQVPAPALIIGAIAAALLWSGNSRLIERVLIGLVALMSTSFIVTAALTKPELGQLALGLVPTFNADTLMILGLVGTTIVPYNLFLHAALAKNKWSENELSVSRKDTIRSIGIGGLVSISIIISAAGIAPESNITNAVELAESLEPIYGSLAKYLLSLGLFAAGITSAVTAPLAAAYVAQGCFAWDSSLSSWKFRMVWGGVVATGVCFSSIGIQPIEIIKFAQVTNGLLLPVIAGLLIWLGTRSSLLGNQTNTRTQTTIGIVVVLIALTLGIKSIWSVF